MKKLLCFILVALFAFSLSGCVSTDKSSDKLSIVAVSFPEYDFARAVAGDNADIRMLIPPGGETHGYEPTVSDIKAVNNCDLFIFTGGESDTWVQDILKSADKNVNTLALIDFVALVESDSHNHGTNAKTDEHIWTSPVNAITLTNAVCDKLSEIKPEKKSYFEANAESYCEKLAKLNSDFINAASNAKRNILVFADRFPLIYFANEYRLEHLAAFPGCSEDTEASAKTVATLIDYVKSNNIPVVFINELSNTAIADQIATETDAEVRTFYSCHKISKDDFESGKTYIDIMSRNIENLNIALK